MLESGGDFYSSFAAANWSSRRGLILRPWAAGLPAGEFHTIARPDYQRIADGATAAAQQVDRATQPLLEQAEEAKHKLTH